MSNEQLEIIRKKFEALHPVPEGVKWISVCQEYSTGIEFNALRKYSAMWQGYLSCMSQEIELPQYWMQFDNAKAVYVTDVIAVLEAQGYRVKRWAI